MLITGEIGTGKELVAAALDRHSRRRDRPYLAIAPVALNPALLESDLFGHIRGAFTGASNDRRGIFESAAGGTVFLDQIGELLADLQVKLSCWASTAARFANDCRGRIHDCLAK